MQTPSKKNLMKSIACLVLVTVLMSTIGCDHLNTGKSSAKSSDQNTLLYQLKTYTFDTPEQVLVTDNYLGKALLPGLKRLGIENVGVFKPRPSGTDPVMKIFVLIPFTSPSQFLNLEGDLARDEAYLSAGNEYLNAKHDQPPYRRIESILLEPFRDMPFIKAPALDGERSKRVYELRSYESATEAYHHSKVDMFNAGGEIRLFEQLGFNAVFYARVLSGSRMPNLIYMISFPDEASRNEHWNAFGNSPVWKELKVISKYQNNVSHIDINFLYPTDYSDY